MSTPQIIRTVEELEALAPETVLVHGRGLVDSAEGIIHQIQFPTFGRPPILPAVVVATGSQVRTARKALEGEAKHARPDAHEMQGILGSEWLDGESPADLVRRHREGRA